MRRKNDELYGRIIEYVNGYFEQTGHSPSTREIEAGVSVPRPTVQRYLKSLQERGEIEYDGHRGIVTEYMREIRNSTRMQMGNAIPCGSLDEVADAELEYIRMPTALTGNGDFFLLRAKGESMINACIDDGDLVLIRRQETAREGQIVAFLYDSAATTLKRYEPSDESITLRPENDEMDPIVIRGDDCANLRIQGVATMVIKNLE